MDDFETELKKDFLAEAKQMLSECESAFIELDAGNRSPELLNKIFRIAHNIKGSGRAVGFEGLGQLAHHFEDILSAIKDGKIPVTKDVCTLLLKGLDGIQGYVDGLASDLNYAPDLSSLNTELKDALHKFTNPPQEAPQQAPVDEVAQTEPPQQDTPQREALEAQIPNAQKRTPPAAQKTAPPKSADEYLRVSIPKLDMLLNIVGELVINQSIMTSHRHNETVSTEHAIQTLAYIEKLVAEIQDVALTLRMMPVRSLFQKMHRIVRDLSVSQKKNIEFTTEGEHVELDKTVIERMSDALTHIIRNAVDHGLESSEDRVKNGKPDQGHVHLSAEQKESHVFITIRDDGRGLDRVKILKKAIENGLVSKGSNLTDQEVYSLIFQPGFSTAEKLTDISGRGVGMDVVMQVLNEMKGNVQIQTELGKGTSFIISLPLSLSIIDGMIVRVDDRKYVIPVAQMLETLEYDKVKVETSTGSGRMMNLRGEVIPIYSLRKILQHDARSAKDGTAPFGFVASALGRKVSFEVDEIVGQQQIVIKKLGSELDGLPGIVGGAILDDGEPGLILSVQDFVIQRSRRNAA